jgi:hexokinase
MKAAEDFIINHKLRARDIDLGDLVTIFTGEMNRGLEGKNSSLRMIPTYIEPENAFLKDTPVLAIDAGGTNFRAALITFRSNGKIETGQTAKYTMPGIECEISGKEFFETVASYIRPLAEKTDRIGFCFSYPTEIFPDKDGRLLQFCKEVQAPEVVGQLIGKTLLETLGTPEKKIVLLNDTVATLLAGKSASFGKLYDSYIGYILGTGTNTCYIEYNSNILKNPGLDQQGSQIINIESGAFGKAPRTDLDILFDSSTMDPGRYGFEKMFAGGYFGGLCLTVIKSAASEGIFSSDTMSKLSVIEELTSEEANDFALKQSHDKNPLSRIFTDNMEAGACVQIIDTLIDRAACLAAANMAAVVLKTGKGKSDVKPVLITVEGTAFYKLHNLKISFEKYLEYFLDGERKRFLKYAEVKQSSLIGAALAGLTD